MRKPEIICIGTQKAGTSWFHEVMGSRSDVWVPPFKEIHFFDHKFVEWNRRWTRSHIKRGVANARARHLSLNTAPDQDYLSYLDRIEAKPMFNGQWYQDIFSLAPEGTLCLDVTPEYCTIPNEGVNFVERFLPDSKFIMIIRDPVDRAVSQVRMNAARRSSPPETTDDWLELAKSPQVELKGNYASMVPRWDKRFGEKRLLFLPFSQIQTDPRRLLAIVEAFLELPTSEYVAANRVIHKSQGPTVPEEVVRFFKSRLQKQTDFIFDRFGRDFL